MFIEKLDGRDPRTGGTFLQGELVNITYYELIDIFGPPNSNGDGHKIEVEWRLFIEGHIVTIYNWKNGKKYLGEYGIPVENMFLWNVGGHTREAYSTLLKYIREYGDGKPQEVENKKCLNSLIQRV